MRKFPKSSRTLMLSLLGSVAVVGAAYAGTAPAKVQTADATPASKDTPAAPAAKTDGTPATTAPTEAATVEKVVVTAQKRSQALQKIPVSVTAITADKLEKTGVDGVDKLDRLAPGLTVDKADRGILNLSVRGISNFTGTILSSPVVGTYLDEAPLSAIAGGSPQAMFWDAQRVEVLRGPQGTLFGESSMGGTIRVIMNKPDSHDFSGRVIGQWSTVNDGGSGWQGRGVLNVPIVEDELAVRVGVSAQKLLGWVDVPDLGKKDSSDGDQEDGKVAVRWTPTQQLTIDATYWHQKLNANSTVQTSRGRFLPSEQNPGALPVHELSFTRQKRDMENVTATYDFGSVNLVGSVTHFQQDTFLSNDLTPAVALFLGVGGTARSTSPVSLDATTAELRLSSDGDQRFNWLVGAYVRDETRTRNTGGIEIIAFPIPPFFPGLTDQAFTSGRGSVNSAALFGNAEYKFTDQLSLQVGARYYWADLDQNTHIDTTSGLFGLVAGTTQTGAGKSNAFTPMATLTWQASDNVLMYARYATGFRDGGTNFTVPTEPTIVADFGPEKIKSYEIGVKTQLTNWLTANAAIYRNDWTDLQLGFVTPDGLFGYVQNAGKVKAVGGELEIAARLAEGLTAGVNVASIDSTIQQDVRNALGGLVVKGGNEIPHSPRFQTSLFTNYEFPIDANVTGSVSAAYSYRSSTYSDAPNTAAFRNKAYGNLNLRFAAQTEEWSGAVFVDNAMDSDATIEKRLVASFFVGSNYVQPRTIGIEIGRKF